MQPKVKRTGVCHMWHKLLAKFCIARRKPLLAFEFAAELLTLKQKAPQFEPLFQLPLI